MRVLVAGGGIGGLTTAIALRHQGITNAFVRQSQIALPLDWPAGDKEEVLAYLRERELVTNVYLRDNIKDIVSKLSLDAQASPGATARLNGPSARPRG